MCKEWHKIIKSPIFMREHLNYHRNKPHKILVYDHSHSPDPITLISKDGVRENLPSEETVRGMDYLFGSVDGLFLVIRVIHISLSLWNPATRKVRHLPDPNFELPPHNPRPLISHFGFGLDLVTYDYKVVWFLRFATSVARATVYSCSRTHGEPFNLTITTKRSHIYHVLWNPSVLIIWMEVVIGWKGGVGPEFFHFTLATRSLARLKGHSCARSSPLVSDTASWWLHCPDDPLWHSWLWDMGNDPTRALEQTFCLQIDLGSSFIHQVLVS